MKNVVQAVTGGAAGALLIGALMAQSPPMIVRSDGLQFPDGSVQTTAAAEDPRRAFYLSISAWDGASATGGCESGFHMASLWEILDLSNLRYATEVADAQINADSGQGPPSGIWAWARTGEDSKTVKDYPGNSNCAAWTSSSADHHGTVIELEDSWIGDHIDPPNVDWLGPWDADAVACNTSWSVWCVQN